MYENSETLPYSGSKPVSEMNLVEVAEQLERITSWIEAERAKEREARAAYNAIQQQVDLRVQNIRKYAEELVAVHERKMSAFSGMLSRQPVAAPASSRSGPLPAPSGSGKGGKMNIADAIVAIWNLPIFQESLTTEEIYDALPQTGYKSNAAPTSLRSSINQALAKLCRSGRVIRYRSDGSRISPKDNTSRARKYILASIAKDE